MREQPFTIAGLHLESKIAIVLFDPPRRRFQVAGWPTQDFFGELETLIQLPFKPVSLPGVVVRSGILGYEPVLTLEAVETECPSDGVIRVTLYLVATLQRSPTD